MKSNRIVVGTAGALLFLSIVVTFGVLLKPAAAPDAREIALEALLARIGAGEIRALEIEQTRAEAVDVGSVRHRVTIGGESSREALVRAAFSYNSAHPNAPIKVSESPDFGGLGHVLLGGLLRLFALSALWLATLFAIVYAVITLSRNKG